MIQVRASALKPSDQEDENEKPEGKRADSEDRKEKPEATAPLSNEREEKLVLGAKPGADKRVSPPKPKAATRKGRLAFARGGRVSPSAKAKMLARIGLD